MNSSRSFRIPWLGVIFVVLGLMLLIEKLGYYHLHFGMIFWPLVLIFGFMKVVEGFSGNNSGRIFFGTICFLYGVYFLLRSSDYFEMRFHMFLPATFIIIGFAFVMIFLNTPREWAFLLPAILLMSAGIAYLLSDVGYFSPWEVRELVRLYWPVGLIIAGLAIILRWRSQKSAHTPSEPPPPGMPGESAGPMPTA
jgi:hypothetical protein